MPTNPAIISEWKNDICSIFCKWLIDRKVQGLLHTVPLLKKRFWHQNASCVFFSYSVTLLVHTAGSSQRGMWDHLYTVHAQTHILSRSTLTLSLVGSTADVRGNHVSLSYPSTYCKPAAFCFHNSTDDGGMVCLCVCVCLQTVPRILVSDLVFFPAFVYFITQGQWKACVSCSKPPFFLLYT